MKFILKTISENKIDIIWFGYGNISFPLIKKVKQARPDLKVVCDTDSVWSKFVLRELPFEKDPVRGAEIERRGREKELEEREWVNLCEVTTAVSEVDAEYYRNIAREPDRIMLFSNVIDLKTYQDPPAPPHGFKKPCIYLAGTFGPKSPMEQSARWIIDKVFPKIKGQIPDLHFYIVGNGSKEILSDIAHPDISILGKLPSVLSYLCHADVALVPLRFESGTRFKILEAGACSIPIVSTVLGAEGIPVSDGKDILLADETDAFAEAIIMLIEDNGLAANVAANCCNLVQERYSVEYLEKEGHCILEKLSRQQAH